MSTSDRAALNAVKTGREIGLKLFLLVFIMSSALLFVLDAEASRRSLRLEPPGFGAWGDTDSCDGSSAVDFAVNGPRNDALGLDLRGIVFSASDNSFVSSSNICQRTVPFEDGFGEFDYFNQVDFDSSLDAGLAALVGTNTDNSVTGFRYASTSPVTIDVACCQWVFYVFPNNITLVRFRGFEGQPLQAGTSISKGDDVYFRGDIWPDYDGELFCFSGQEFKGVWDEQTFVGKNPLSGCVIDDDLLPPPPPPPPPPPSPPPSPPSTSVGTSITSTPAINLLLLED